MANNPIFKAIKKTKTTLDEVGTELGSIKELKAHAKELNHHWKILTGIDKTVNKLERDDTFHYIKEEIIILIDELHKIKSVDNNIKNLSKMVVSEYESLVFKNETDTIKLFNIKREEIILTEKRIANAIIENKHSIIESINLLKLIDKVEALDFKNRFSVLENIGQSLTHIRQVYFQTQAIIKLELGLKKKKKATKDALNKIKRFN